MLTGNANVYASSSYSDALKYWENVLQTYVDNEGRVDFSGLTANTKELENYVAFVAEISPATHPEKFPSHAEILSYHINTYNALAMHGVIVEEVKDGFNSFFKRAAFFKFHDVIIGGKSTSLSDYENKVIRKFNEPRVHFALNCMVRDCPRLPKEAFRAETLDSQLDAVTREFFSKEKHIRIDHNKRSVWLSAILDFYTKDFVSSKKTSDLMTYVNPYLDNPVPTDFRVRFIKYDWTLNQQP